METRSAMDKSHSGKLSSGQNEENVAADREAFGLTQVKSIQRTSAELNINDTSMHCGGGILKNTITVLPAFRKRRIKGTGRGDWESPPL